MIAIDIGNRQSIISDGRNIIKRETTIAFTTGNHIQVGEKREKKYVIYDFLILLGTKYMDEQFSKVTKFYEYDYEMSKRGKIMIVLPLYEGMKHKKLHVQTVVALFLKELINTIRMAYHFQKYPKLAQFIENHRFYITVSGLANHPFRYGLKQVCEMIGVESPILVNSCHMSLCSYYVKSKQSLNQVQQVCVVQFGDKGSTVTMYKLQGYQQRIIQVKDHASIKLGGYHLTKSICEFMIGEIKDQKGMDLNRYGRFMNVLHNQCENAKINIIDCEEKQSLVRVADLPDQSSFGKVINQKLLYEIIRKDISKVINMVEQNLLKHKNIKQIIMIGCSTRIPLFEREMVRIINKMKLINQVSLIKLQKLSICDGIVAMQQQQIIVFDVAEANYEVTGQEGFKRKLMNYRDDIPERKSEKTKFPAGELQFNLRLYENGIKVGHFLLESRPAQTQFGLNFEINRNKLVNLYVQTGKGKIECPADFQTLSQQQIIANTKIVNQYLS